MLKRYENFNKYNLEYLPISLLEKSEEYCDNNYSIKREKCPIYAMEYIIKGENFFNINGYEFTAHEGDIVFIPKNSNHTYYNNKKEKCHKLWFVFDGSIINHLLLGYISTNKYKYHIKECYDIFEQIISLSCENSSYKFVNDNFSLLLHRLLITISNNEKESESQNYSTVNKIQKYIDENLLTPFSLSMIEKEFNYSKNHIILMFKKQYKITPNQYYNQKKIELACLFLKNTTQPIKEISEELGFFDQHYFSNLFYKVKRMTPSQYRKMLTQ